jgi:hypothetical protein
LVLRQLIAAFLSPVVTTFLKVPEVATILKNREERRARREEQEEKGKR